MQKVEINFGYEEVKGEWMGKDITCCTDGGTIYGYADFRFDNSGTVVESFELEDIVCMIKFKRTEDGVEVEQTYHQEYDSLYQQLMNKVEDKYINSELKKVKEIA